jgi:hypothetical protein
MTRRLLVLALALATSTIAVPALAAPSAEETAVLAAAQRLFDAMAVPDAAGVQAAVLPGSMFTAIRKRPDGTRQMSRITVEQFAANLRPGLFERMWAPQVSLRGDMIATVSAPYEFQLDGKTTHCGIDVFDLAKVDGAWKIAGLTWTAEPDACAELKARK